MSWLWGSGSDSSTGSVSSSSFDSGPSYSSDSSFSSFDTGSSFDSSSLGGGAGAGTGLEGKAQDAEMQNFLAMEQQRAQFQASVHKMNDTCWESCMGSPESRLSSRTETCITNCVDRFIDSSLFITNRFAQLLSKQGGAGGPLG